MTVDDGAAFLSAAVTLSNDSDVPLIYGSEQATNISDLPKSVLDYYLNIEKVLEGESFENESDRRLLEEKLLDQMKTDGITRILYHWDCSRVVERLLVHSTQPTLIEVGNLILPHILELACHNFASHALEMFIMQLVRGIYTAETAVAELVELAEEVFRKLCLGVSDLISNTHGSYTLRLALQVLVGVRLEDEKKQKKRWEIGKHSFYETSQPHPTLKKILHKFTKRLVREDFTQLLWSVQGAPLLSVLLHLLHKTNSKSLANLKSVILLSFQKKVTDYKGVEKFGPLPEVLLDSKASFVIQSLIKVCNKEELLSLYSDHFQSILVPLSLHPVANYTIQSMLQHAPSANIADNMCSQLLPLFEDLLAECLTGVVASVIKCCHHYNLKSHNVMKVLQSAFHLPDDQLHLFFRCLMSLTTLDLLQEKLESYKKPTQSGKPRRDRFEATLPGSLLLQEVFKLGEVALLEEGLCTLSDDHVIYLSNDPQASHAIQAFLTSATVPLTTKHRFIKRGVSVVDSLVTSPSGSRIVEAMWNSADIEIKSAIAQVLVEKEQAIKDNTYGAIVWKKCNLKAFKMGSDSWEKAEHKKRKRIETFEKIIGDVDTQKTIVSQSKDENQRDSLSLNSGDGGVRDSSTERCQAADACDLVEKVNPTTEKKKIKKSKKLKVKHASDG